MLTAYIQAALRHAHYELLPDGEGFYGSVEALPGVWANAETLEACRTELQEVIEDGLLVRLRRGAEVPVLEEIDLNTATTGAA
jgi:predicted RNase H-like HicB family nuclease